MFRSLGDTVPTRAEAKTTVQAGRNAVGQAWSGCRRASECESLDDSNEPIGCFTGQTDVCLEQDTNRTTHQMKASEKESIRKGYEAGFARESPPAAS